MRRRALFLFERLNDVLKTRLNGQDDQVSCTGGKKL